MITLSNKRAAVTVESCDQSIHLFICDVVAQGLPAASGVRCVIEIDGKQAILNSAQLSELARITGSVGHRLQYDMFGCNVVPTNGGSNKIGVNNV